MSRHSLSGSIGLTVASIRRRLVLESHLTTWEQPTPEAMLRYYGELPPALPGPHVTYTFNAHSPNSVGEMQRRVYQQASAALARYS